MGAGEIQSRAGTAKGRRRSRRSTKADTAPSRTLAALADWLCALAGRRAVFRPADSGFRFSDEKSAPPLGERALCRSKGVFRRNGRQNAAAAHGLPCAGKSYGGRFIPHNCLSAP